MQSSATTSIDEGIRTEPSPDLAERRRHPRYELLANVRVDGAKSDRLMTMINISQSGALVDMGSLACPGWIAVDRVIEIGVVHPETLDTLKLRGRVVRVIMDGEGTHFAIEFITSVPSEGDEDAASIAEQTTAVEGLVALAASLRKRPPPLPKS